MNSLLQSALRLLRLHAPDKTAGNPNDSNNRNKPDIASEKAGADAEYTILEKLLQHFREKKPYLNPNLTIDCEAKAIGTNKNYLSKAVNTAFQTNFSQVCNRYRIRHACQRFISSNAKSLGSLYKASGFASHSTFAMAFSLNLHTTPMRWGKAIRNRQALGEVIGINEELPEPVPYEAPQAR